MAATTNNAATSASKGLQRPLRVITATSLFDGHDAAINVIRRLIQNQGIEVIHLGHSRRVDEIVHAALQEDVDAIAISSYQGGHLEFFRYLRDQLVLKGAEHVRIFGGGGGTITVDEIAEMEAYGIEKIYSSEDGLRLGLNGMVQDLLARSYAAYQKNNESHNIPPKPSKDSSEYEIGRALTQIETDNYNSFFSAPQDISKQPRGVCIGITGTGGAGKSSVLDELLHQCLNHYPQIAIAVLAIDPTRQKHGGALLGDRIRINSLTNSSIFMRSMATRQKHLAINAALAACIQYLRSAEFDLIIIETAGAGQGSSELVGLVDLSLYVMTHDYGAASQLEKIEMLDSADIIILNKFDKHGSQDALRDIRKQWRRNHDAFDDPDETIPVIPTIASRYNDIGIRRVFKKITPFLEQAGLPLKKKGEAIPCSLLLSPSPIVPQSRRLYLSRIGENGLNHRSYIDQQVTTANQVYCHYQSLQALNDPDLPSPLEHFNDDTQQHQTNENPKAAYYALRLLYRASLEALDLDAKNSLRDWLSNNPIIKEDADKEYITANSENSVETPSHLRIPKIAMPRYVSWGDILRFLLKENLPGEFPYTAGNFHFKRTAEDPTRIFAGEGTPETTNSRFHYLSSEQPYKRLSTAFDPITLYGEEPHEQPDIYGRIGMSGVSIATLDDVKKLYSGFDLCASNTSVSMTINGPAPFMLACFFNAAIDQQVELYLRNTGHWSNAEKTIKSLFKNNTRSHYKDPLPAGNEGLGLGLLGVSKHTLIDNKIVTQETYMKLREDTLGKIRGTVQADILKEDQAQNECILPVEFALHLMGDVQAFLINNNVKKYYGVSVSGYHIAEAGANPVTQLAFTLANGFTLIEYYLSRGMHVDDVASHMSFFFSNGMDPEYAVIGRVARRIWAHAMRDFYHANPRSQMLKYHIQTSGRSLHAQDIAFNDIRTTLQAQYAIYDNCNSLHTNAYDEAVTTPTEESVRRALAIQMIINKELGLSQNDNPLQGSFIIEQLTDLVEEAVYKEFEQLSKRDGVLGAMENLYQRSKIQDESLEYEQRKHDGRLPLVGVNTFIDKKSKTNFQSKLKLRRSSHQEKQAQIDALHAFQVQHKNQSENALRKLQHVICDNSNSFEELMETVQYCSIGQITHALYEVGGRYRRAM